MAKRYKNIYASYIVEQLRKTKSGILVRVVYEDEGFDKPGESCLGEQFEISHDELKQYWSQT